MYGLTHRIANDTPAERDVVEPSPLARISSLGARATVMVIDRDPLTLAMVRRAVANPTTWSSPETPRRRSDS
jgi:hypothetical protein